MMEISARSFCRATLARFALCLSAVVLITACGGGSGGVEPQIQPPSDAPATGTAEYTPDVGVDLQIAYADGQSIEGNDAFIEAQWAHMQSCLQVSAQEPEVTVVATKITPVDSSDDVIRHIDGQILASSHVTDSSASIQIRVLDFDGTVGEPGAHLRSIMGRYLWLANSLNERDYPYACADGA